MTTVRRCSRCGKQGHNRRSCGKPAPAGFVTGGKNRGVSKVSPAKSGKVNSLDVLWDKVRERDGGGGSVGEGAGVDGFTLDEFDTWWHLTSSGRDGKAGKGKSSYDRKNPLWTANDTLKIMEILREAAKSPNVRPAAAKKFLSQFGAEAKLSIASRKDLPLVFLVALSKDPSVYVREKIALRKDTPAGVLEMMWMVETKESVAASIASNEKTPAEVLKYMFQRRDVYRNKNSFSVSYSEGAVADALLRNPNLPSDCVAVGFTSSSFRTFCSALRNPHLPADVLEAEWNASFTTGHKGMSPVKRLEYRGAIAGNPNCPEKILWKIAQGEGGHRAAAEMWNNPNISERAAQRAWDRETRSGRFCPTPVIISAIAQNENVPYWIIEKAYENKWVPFHLLSMWEERIRGGQ